MIESIQYISFVCIYTMKYRRMERQIEWVNKKSKPETVNNKKEFDGTGKELMLRKTSENGDYLCVKWLQISLSTEHTSKHTVFTCGCCCGLGLRSSQSNSAPSLFKVPITRINLLIYLEWTAWVNQKVQPIQLIWTDKSSVSGVHPM